MRLLRLTILLLAALPLAAQNKTLAPEVLYANSKGSVVTIMTYDASQTAIGQGSGFVVGKNRVITNYHVLAGSHSASIIFEDGSTVNIKAVIAASHPKDLVVVEADTGSRPALLLGDELQLKIGETVYAIGTPHGLAASLSNGLVSAFRQEEGQFLIQTTAAIAPGSSGGPLLNTQGQVVCVTSSRLKDSGFSFAIGAGDMQRLLKVLLTVKMRLSDLDGEGTERADDSDSGDDLSAVRHLVEQQKYEDAKARFQRLSVAVKASFDGQLLLCRIEERMDKYDLAIDACNAAIEARPQAGDPYGLKAYALLMMGEIRQAETVDLKATQLSDDEYYKTLLGLIYYAEEKFDLVPKQIPSDTDDAFLLTQLVGAAYHNGDAAKFRKLRAKLISVKGENNGWQYFIEASNATRDLNFEVALDQYRKCDEDRDFVDSICLLGAANVQIHQGNYEGAKKDIDTALKRYPESHSVLSEAIFIYLVAGYLEDAKPLHTRFKDGAHRTGDALTDCLYYYGTNQPDIASDYCGAAIEGNESEYVVWSNAGYAALDNAQFDAAIKDFSKAWDLFYASKEKHMVVQVLDVEWGMIMARYYSGDHKGAKELYRNVKKTYPKLYKASNMKDLQLVWSENTLKLMARVCADYK